MNWKTAIVEEQPAAVRQAIVELEARGLKFCTHFSVPLALIFRPGLRTPAVGPRCLRRAHEAQAADGY